MPLRFIAQSRFGVIEHGKGMSIFRPACAVISEDTQAVLPAVAGHRLGAGHTNSDVIVTPILDEVPAL